MPRRAEAPRLNTQRRCRAVGTTPRSRQVASLGSDSGLDLLFPVVGPGPYGLPRWGSQGHAPKLASPCSNQTDPLPGCTRQKQDCFFRESSTRVACATAASSRLTSIGGTRRPTWLPQRHGRATLEPRRARQRENGGLARTNAGRGDRASDRERALSPPAPDCCSAQVNRTLMRARRDCAVAHMRSCVHAPLEKRKRSPATCSAKRAGQRSTQSQLHPRCPGLPLAARSAAFARTSSKTFFASMRRTEVSWQRTRTVE